MLIAAYRALSRTAAAIAAAAPPPVCRIEVAANWAEPAKVVADMTAAAAKLIPAVRASNPNDAAKAAAAMPIGSAARAPCL